MDKLYLIIWIILFLLLMFFVFGPSIRHNYIKFKRYLVHFYDSKLKGNFVQTDY